MKSVAKLPFGEGGLGKPGVARTRRRRLDSEPAEYPRPKARLKKREGAREKGRLADFEGDDLPEE